MTELKDILNLQITEYLKPKHLIYKLHFYCVATVIPDDDDDEYDEEPYPCKSKHCVICEAKEQEEEEEYPYLEHLIVKKKLSMYDLNDGIDIALINKIYSPTTANGLNQIEPLTFNGSNSLAFLYRIERLA